MSEQEPVDAPAAVEAAWVRRGPCGLCGYRDARHRIWDSILSRRRGGDELDDLAQDYDVPLAAIVSLIQWWRRHPDAEAEA